MSNFKYDSEFNYDPNDLFGHMQEEFPKKSEFDVVIIGAGPNGLMAAAYLARAGLSVGGCERRFAAGGRVGTAENPSRYAAPTPTRLGAPGRLRPRLPRTPPSTGLDQSRPVMAHPAWFTRRRCVARR